LSTIDATPGTPTAPDPATRTVAEVGAMGAMGGGGLPGRRPAVRVDFAEREAGDRLGAAFEACRQVAKSRARNFYYGLRLTPEPRRSAIYAVYAWMRAADDIADDGGDLAGRRARLESFAGATRAAFRDDVDGVDEPVLLAFATTVRAYALDPAWFDEVIAGLQGDLAGAPLPDDAALSTYCYRVAGTVGLSCVGIWGLRLGADPDRAAELAQVQGQAFQRTNILRDFAEDFDLTPSRVYLPVDAFARHGLAPRQLRDWASPDPCEALVLEQAAIARAAYERAAPLRDLIDPACVPTLWAMTEIYSGILAVIERSPRAIVAGRRVGLSAAKKAAIAARAVLGARRSGGVTGSAR
jgi:phytoene synthase